MQKWYYINGDGLLVKEKSATKNNRKVSGIKTTRGSKKLPVMKHKIISIKL